jgi:Asp-tRNA(Asn)/Glu-tRNA(Gln) amidotransferase A subunit family amidase
LRLEEAGYSVRHVPALNDIETINHHHRLINFAEMAQVHAEWFASYETLYRPLTVKAIRDGQKAGAEELQTARAGRAALRSELEALMSQHDIDLWVSPAAPGPAPEGITTTGNSNMNLPWTYTGTPAMTLPGGHAANGLPLGLQITGAAMADEKLVAWAQRLAELLG